MREKPEGWWGRESARALAALVMVLVVVLLAGAVGFDQARAAGMGRDQGALALVPAHALPVKEEPAENAILKAPPSQVCMWFSEALNPATSHLVVVDPTNHEVDKGDSTVGGADNERMCVTMQLVPAGTYVVAWRTESAIDGHVVGGSYIFQVARPDGTVPPIPSKLPTGHFPGAGGTTSGTGTTLDGPTTLQAVGNWLAYIFLAFWLGGLIWETWILSPAGQADPDLDVTARRSHARFLRLAPYALAGVLIADVLMIFGETAELAGGFSGMANPALLRAVILGSQFGTFWVVREVLALVSLGLLGLAVRQGWARSIDRTAAHGLPEGAGADDETLPIPDWRREFLLVWREIPTLPRRLVQGIRARTNLERVELLLGAGLLVAFALSGHAAAVPTSQLPLALTADLIHLVGTAIWVGGLLYISIVLVPALGAFAARRRARVLALGLPAFSALAVVSVVALALSGVLNGTVHLTSVGQILSTTYGRILAVKTELFLLMVAISFYHAFILRPRLAYALTPADAPSTLDAPDLGATDDEPASAQVKALTMASGRGGRARTFASAPPTRRDGRGDAHRDEPRGAFPADTSRLTRRMEDWLRREAWLGMAVLLCVALLAAFAGTLETTPVSASGGQSGPYVATQAAGPYSVAINVSPDTFGTNTFTVTVTDPHGNTPVSGASVIIQTTMLDMDMGTQTAQLQPVSGKPGVYAGSSELTMAGHWALLVKVLPPNGNTFVITTFKFFANQG